MSETIPKSFYASDKADAYWRDPLDSAKFQIPHGKVNVIKDRCKSCEFCIEFCPRGILELSDEFNTKGYHPPRVAEKDGCIACRLCELICPEFAIHITEDEPAKQVEDPRNGSK